MGLRIPAIWLAEKHGNFYWPTVCSVQGMYMYAYNAPKSDSPASSKFLCISKMHCWIYTLAHALATCEFAIAMCPVTSYLPDSFWDLFSRPIYKTDDTQAYMYFVDQWEWVHSFNFGFNSLNPTGCACWPV